MIVGMVLICLVLAALLIVAASIVPTRPSASKFELTRRASNGDASARTQLDDADLVDDVESLLKAFQSLVLVLFVTASVAAFGWLIGIMVSVVLSLSYGKIARVPLLTKWAAPYYGRIERSVIEFLRHHRWVGSLFRSVTTPLSDPIVESREQLHHLIDTSRGIVSLDEKKRLIASIQFDSRRVVDIMTPRSVIDSVPVSEVLGPLLLNDLHATGHTRFPVIDGDIDRIVGMLYIQNLLVVSASSKSTTVKKAMDTRVHYIKDTQPLTHALAAFLRTHHHLLIVVNEFQETVGLLSLEDVIESLLGRKIVDEFDVHDDLRAVAARQAHDAKARSSDRVDV